MSRFFPVRCRSKLAPISAQPISYGLFISFVFKLHSQCRNNYFRGLFNPFLFKPHLGHFILETKRSFWGPPLCLHFFFKFAKLQVKPITAQSSQYCFVIGCALNQSQLRPRSKVTCLSTWDLVTVGRLSNPGRVIG